MLPVPESCEGVPIPVAAASELLEELKVAILGTQLVAESVLNKEDSMYGRVKDPPESISMYWVAALVLGYDPKDMVVLELTHWTVRVNTADDYKYIVYGPSNVI